MRRQLPNSQKPFRLFRDTEQELAREQATLRLTRQDPQSTEDRGIDNKPILPAGRTGKIPEPPASHEPAPAAGFIQEPDPEVSLAEHNGFSEPDWPFGSEGPEASQMASDTPSSMIFGELATAYVPWQMFTQTLSLREALRAGTLFPELIRTPPLYKRPEA